MRRVYKYELPDPNLDGEAFEIDIPNFAKILSVGVQGEHNIMLWVEVPDPYKEATRKLRLRIVATGQDFPSDGSPFIGTVQLPAGYVFHIFEAHT